MSYAADLGATLEKLLLATRFVEEHDALLSAEMVEYYKKLCRLAIAMLNDYETRFLEKHSRNLKEGDDVYEL